MNLEAAIMTVLYVEKSRLGIEATRRRQWWVACGISVVEFSNFW